MKQNRAQLIKTALILASPLLLFLILLIPYSLLNQHLIVDLFGCGCPKIDELGNTVYPDFNANDFTAIFWTVIAVCAAGISVFLSKRIPRKTLWLRILYVIGILMLSLLIANHLCQKMMWN